MFTSLFIIRDTDIQAAEEVYRVRAEGELWKGPKDRSFCPMELEYGALLTCMCSSTWQVT